MSHFRFAGTIILLTILYCGQNPVDPSTVPANAAVTVVSVNGNPPVEPIGVTAGDSVKLVLHPSLPKFIDSVSVLVEMGDASFPVLSTISRPVDTSSIAAAILFQGKGTGRCVIFVHITTGIVSKDTLLFDVAAKKMNHPPVIKGDTLSLYSEFKKSKIYNLAAYVSDIDSDAVSLALVPELKGFTVNGTLITGAATLDTGMYVSTIIAYDGQLSDSAWFVWRVIATGDTGIKTDPNDTQTVITDPKDTVQKVPLAFVQPETLVVVDESKLSTVTFTVAAKDTLPVAVAMIEHPSFVSAEAFGNGIKLTCAPGYDIASSVQLTVDSLVKLRAVSGGDTVYQTVTIRVKNSNRPPAFTSYPKDTQVVLPGSTYLSESLAGSDPDNDAVFFRLVTTIDGMSIISGRKIEWKVPATGYASGQVVSVVVRITDGSAFFDVSIIFKIG